MTKKNEKRRIEIEDKRMRDGLDGPDELMSELEADAREVLGDMDDALFEFTTAGQAAAGKAAMAEDAAQKYKAAQPEAPAEEQDELVVVKPAASEVELTPEEQIIELRDMVQRKEAELRNFQKRVQQDMSDARRFAMEGLLFELFPALDGMAQAAQTYKDTPDGENPLLDGVRSTVKAVDKALLKHGIEKINTVDVEFDPELHQPLNVETNSDVEAEMVAEVYVEGYRLGDKILKPAMVRVVKPA